MGLLDQVTTPWVDGSDSYRSSILSISSLWGFEFEILQLDRSVGILRTQDHIPSL